MKRVLAMFVSMGLLFSAWSVERADAQEAAVADCSITDSTVIDVVLLLDQSASLRRTDSDDQRVAGARSVVRAYAAIAPRVQEVRIAIAGFGEDATSTEWIPLDEATVDEVLRLTEEFASRDDGNHTDYVYALNEASEAFSRSSGATCRTLFWFTDGEHDLDAGFLGAGLERFYVDEPVTTSNYADIEAMMPELICGPGGYAGALGDLDVSTRVMLLGDGERMDQASARVLRGLGGDATEGCGSGLGSFESVSSAEELPFRMACLAQQGLQSVDVSDPVDGTLTLTQGAISANGLPASLLSELLVIARGSAGNPPVVDSSRDAESEIVADAGSGTAEITVRPTSAEFETHVTGVDEACVFATFDAPSLELRQLTPTLTEGEEGRFHATAAGNHGPLTEEESNLFDLSADASVARSDEGWILTVRELPPAGEHSLTATVSGGGFPPVAETITFQVNEQLNAPEILSHPEPIIGEGIGPFRTTVRIDGRDGGELCLATDRVPIEAAETTLEVQASIDGQGPCVEVRAGEVSDHEIVLDLTEQVFATGAVQFETVSRPADRPDRQMNGVLTVDLDVTPEANTVLVGVIVAALILALLLLIWLVMYGINRLVSRIPDPGRRNVRFAEFSCRVVDPGDGQPLRVELVEAPKDTDLRKPRRTPSELRAGSLRIQRKVPLAPWRLPYAIASMGSDKLIVDTGRGVVRRAVVGDRTVRARPSDATGPLAALSISKSQWSRIADGSQQNLSGVVLVDLSKHRGEVASRVTASQLSESLGRMKDQLTDARDRSAQEGVT
ncbi:MAG TPA: VWA domain-containing protein [Acidimicrobiia bacterium]|nr:VWA domain-containing protein [Acidimicrobiia bacterium]